MNLRTHDNILAEIEEIVSGVKNKNIDLQEAKLRMWGVKNSIRIMALKMIENRFQSAIPALPDLSEKKD